MSGLGSLPSWVIGDQPIHRLEVEREVAFRDCDPMGVLWHGNYLAYAEVAREALGRSLGWGVPQIRDRGLFAPVVRSQTVHRAPARPGDILTVAVGLYATAQPRLLHRYQMAIAGTTVAEVETEQVFTDRAFTLILRQPDGLAALLGTP